MHMDILKQNNTLNLTLEFVTYLDENWFPCLFGEVKYFQKLKKLAMVVIAF